MKLYMVNRNWFRILDILLLVLLCFDKNHILNAVTNVFLSIKTILLKVFLGWFHGRNWKVKNPKYHSVLFQHLLKCRHQLLLKGQHHESTVDILKKHLCVHNCYSHLTVCRFQIYLVFHCASYNQLNILCTHRICIGCNEELGFHLIHNIFGSKHYKWTHWSLNPFLGMVLLCISLEHGYFHTFRCFLWFGNPNLPVLQWFNFCC